MWYVCNVVGEVIIECFLKDVGVHDIYILSCHYVHFRAQTCQFLVHTPRTHHINNRNTIASPPSRIYALKCLGVIEEFPTIAAYVPNLAVLALVKLIP